VTSAKQELVGKSGVTITPLRPSGIAEIEGRRVDVLTAGAFIEKNKPIVVVQAKGLHILVAENKPDETPAETDETQAPADTNA
jgi:membrane-bound serine protease (ClpP class)